MLEQYLNNIMNDHLKVAEATITSENASILATIEILTEAISDGHKILIFGNGGSAADAQHIAAEFVGRFQVNRRALPCIALTTDTSILTAISNDFGYEHVFERQVEAFASRFDVVIGISTSGSSPNVLRALEMGKSLECKTIGMCGNNSDALNKICDQVLSVQSSDTARIQEVHILLGHILCGAIEKRLT